MMGCRSQPGTSGGTYIHPPCIRRETLTLNPTTTITIKGYQFTLTGAHQVRFTKILTYNVRQNWIIYTSRKSMISFSLVVYNWVMFCALVTPVIRTLVPIITELLFGLSALNPIEEQAPLFRLVGHYCSICHSKSC